MRFLACDVQSTHTEHRSGASEEDFRIDARKLYRARWDKDFMFERVYDFLKTLPKWLVDTAQHARTVASAKKKIVVRKKRERMQISESDTKGSIEKGLGQRKAKRVKVELSEAEKDLKEAHEKREGDIALFREKAHIQLKAIKAELLRARIDEEQEENMIMGMDLTGMDDMRLSYFHIKMNDIVERQALRHSAAVAAEAASTTSEAEEAALGS